MNEYVYGENGSKYTIDFSGEPIDVAKVNTSKGIKHFGKRAKTLSEIPSIIKNMWINHRTKKSFNKFYNSSVPQMQAELVRVKGELQNEKNRVITNLEEKAKKLNEQIVDIQSCLKDENINAKDSDKLRDQMIDLTTEFNKVANELSGIRETTETYLGDIKNQRLIDLYNEYNNKRSFLEGVSLNDYGADNGMKQELTLGDFRQPASTESGEVGVLKSEQLASEVQEILHGTKELGLKDKLEEYVNLMSNGYTPKPDDQETTFSDGTVIGQFWHNNIDKINERLCFEDNRLEEYVDLLSNGYTPKFDDQETTFSDGTVIGQFGHNNIDRIKEKLWFKGKLEEYVDLLSKVYDQETTSQTYEDAINAMNVSSMDSTLEADVRNFGSEPSELPSLTEEVEVQPVPYQEKAEKGVCEYCKKSSEQTIVTESSDLGQSVSVGSEEELNPVSHTTIEEDIARNTGTSQDTEVIDETSFNLGDFFSTDKATELIGGFKKDVQDVVEKMVSSYMTLIAETNEYYQQQFQDLKQKYTDISTENESLKGQLEESDKEKVELNRSLEEANSKNTELSDVIRGQQETIASDYTSNEVVKQMQVEYRESLSQQESKFRAEQRARENETKKLGLAQQNYNTYLRKYEDSTRENDDLRRRLTEMDKQYRTLVDSVQTKDDEITRLNGVIQTEYVSREEYQKLSEEHESLNRQYANLRSMLVGLTAQLNPQEVTPEEDAIGAVRK